MVGTYPVAILVGIVLGLWVAGLHEVQCPPGLSTGNCFLVPRWRLVSSGWLVQRPFSAAE